MTRLLLGFGLPLVFLLHERPANAGPSYRLNGGGSAAAVHGELKAALERLGFTPADIEPDLGIELTVSKGAKGTCATAHPTWWDGETRASSTYCAPRREGFTGSSPPSAPEVSRLVIEPLVAELDGATKARWGLTLTNFKREQGALVIRSDALPNVPAPQSVVGDSVTVWLNPSAKAQLSYGPCAASIEPRSPMYDLGVLAGTRGWQLALEPGDSGISVVKGKPFELQLVATPSTAADAVLVSCGGDVEASVEPSATEYDVSPRPTTRNRWSWIVTPKVDRARVAIQVRPAHAASANTVATTRTAEFHPPILSSAWSILTSGLSGIAALLVTLVGIAASIRTLLKRNKAPAPPAPASEPEDG